MFKIPQKLSSPFNILGDEAKLAFRSQPGGISKLTNTRNISESDTYWDQYIVLFDSPSDVFSLITPHDVRRAFTDAPENIATLIKVITSRLFNLVSDHTFPSPQANASVAAFASSFIKAGTGNADRNTTKEVLNCLRILQRVLPVIFEVEGESNRFESEILWKTEEVDEDSADGELAAEGSQFVIEDEDESDTEAGPASVPKAKKKKQLPSLGERLFSCIIDLMFCCGFTLPKAIQKDHYKINYVIWEKGIGSTVDPGPNGAYDNNKTEVLRLLLILLSRQIYVPPASLLVSPSLYTLHIVQKIPRRDVLTVLCSLVNTVMNSSSPGTATTIGSMADKLPYNHLVFKGENPRSALVSICFQVLCVLLDFQSGPARDQSTGTGEVTAQSPTAKTNTFRYFLAKLHRSQDLSFLLDGAIGIMEEQMAILNNLLPGARKSIPYVNDNIIFFWKMIELNKKFRAYVLDSDKAMDVVGYLLCHSLENKDKPQQQGLCRALSYILQTLSAEPAFGLKLCNPIKAQLPTKWSTAGTAADFMINAVYAMVATTAGSLTSLYPAFVIALSNSAPYFKNLSVTSSTRLIQMFMSFMNPMFLLSDEGHPRLLFFMLEVFNSVILHNLSDNPNLIYGILTAHKAFEDLGTFTLSRGLREIKRVQLAKEERARKAEGKGKGRSRDDGISESQEPHEEKARLLESEANHSRDSLGTLGLQALELESTSRPLMSPSSESTPGVSDSSEPLARGKGKMKERSMSLDRTNSLERIAAAGVGRNGFVPTQEWVTSWQQGLPLDAVLLLTSELLPKIQTMQASRKTATSTTAIMDFLSTVTLTDVLPPSPPLTPRRFLWSDASIIWLASLIWGEIYVRGMTPLGIWNNTNVRLFYVKHAQTQPRQITETVSNVVGGFLGRGPDSPSRQQRS